MEPTKIEIEAAYEIWLDQDLATEYFFDFSATLNFDPARVVAESTIRDLMRLAYCVDLSTLCIRLTIDAQQVVAHLDPEPLDLKATEAFLNNIGKDNSGARFGVNLLALLPCIFGGMVYLAYQQADDHPELIHQLDALLAPFRDDVHKALMAEIGKIQKEFLAFA